MLNIVPDLGAKNQARECAGSTVHQYVRGLPVEHAAAGETDDVVQEAQRARDGAVLVVDGRIQVALIGMGDKRAGEVEVVLLPGAKLQPMRGQRFCFRRCGRSRPEVKIHKKTPVHAEGR